MSKIIKTIIITIAFLAYGISFAAEPANLRLIKQQLVQYHDSGEYDKDIADVAHKAQACFCQQINLHNNKNEKLAAVFDIDETSLSLYTDWLELDFGGRKSEIYAMIDRADGTAIAPVLQVYNFAKQHHVAVFFITARHEYQRQATINNLHAVGYNDWNGLYLTPNNLHEKSIIPFKTKIRKYLTDQGYKIILNIGDQESDLAGGYATCEFKLPNPYYYLP